MTIDVRTLGKLAVSLDGNDVTGITAQPVRAALIVYLAVERAATRDAVLACIWPEAAEGHARHTLSQTLYQLRQDLGDAWLDPAGSYLRGTPELSADAVTFTELVEGGRYAEALDLYRGAFLDGCHLVSTTEFERWVDRHRGRLRRLHHRARREEIDRLVGRGEPAAALATARRWVEIEPLEDEAQQRLLQLLADGGAHAEAIRHYEDFARLLAVEELEPLPETAALARAIRRAAPRAEWSPAPRAAPGAPASIATPAATSPRWRTWAAVGLLLGAAALVVSWALLRRGRPESGPLRSVAVLPFENLSGDSSDAYFVDGIREALIADLSRVSDLRVASRTSALRYAGATRSVPEIARELRVDGVIEGSVLKAGDSVRIQASLIAGAADRTIRTVTHVAPLANVLALLRDLARRIAGELALEAAGQTQSTAAAPVIPAAYEDYLRARHLTHDLPAGRWRGADSLFQAAIALDSTFGMAHAGLAQLRFLIGFFGAAPRDSAWEMARTSALKALELDNGLAEAYTVLGYIALYDDWDWQAAERNLLRALRLNPNDAFARHGYADLLTLRGHAQEGLRQVELGHEAEPFSTLVDAALIGHLYLARRFEDAIRRIDSARASGRRDGFGLSVRAAALWQLNRHQEALEVYQRIWTDPGLTAAVTRAEAAGGPPTALRAAADYSASLEPTDSYSLSALYLRSGDPEESLRWLERALAARGPSALHAVMDPVFDSLKSDPRYARLRHQLGLPPV